MTNASKRDQPPRTRRGAAGGGTARRRTRRRRLTVAITGATGTIGPALLRRLAASRDVGRIVVLGRRRPAELPASGGVELRAVDVRDRAAVGEGVEGADVVIHAAFALYGVMAREPDLFATNVEGTLNVARAAAVTGAKRLVYVSSAAVYGFHADNDSPLDERAPLRASGSHFYVRHKAQTELLVREALAGSGTEAFFFRPCGIVGPHAAGALGGRLPAPLVHAGRAALVGAARAGLRPAVPAPPVPLQFVHEDDVAQALVRAALGEGPSGAYNLAGDGMLSGRDAVATLGLRPLPLPRGVVRGALRAVASAPPLIPALGWAEVVSAPVILDTGKARAELGWRPRHSSREALLATREALGW